MTEQTQDAAKVPTVDETVATFSALDDAALQKLHDDEKASDGGGRTTLLDAIHREQASRADAADAAKADADAKAADAGYADAQTQATAEAAAAKAAAAKPKRKAAAKKPAAKSGFDVSGDGAEFLRELAIEGGTATFTLGDDNGPDANLTAVDGTLAFTRGRSGNRDRVSFSSAGMPSRVKFTHYYALDGKTVIGKRELASPLPLAPGEQVAFPAGSLAF